jgi:hypothetical protein
MVYGYHAIFGTYGFWLPNDPRGSWSDYVGLYELYRQFGPATKTTSRQSVAHAAHDHAAREAAKQVLPRPPVVFTGVQARSVAVGFGQSFAKGGVTVWACAVLPDHVHVVFARHAQPSELIVSFMKRAGTLELLHKGLHPFLAERDEDGKVPHCWAEGQWIVYLDSCEGILRAIRYVEDNPIKDGLPPQRWSFVTPFDSTAV